MQSLLPPNLLPRVINFLAGAFVYSSFIYMQMFTGLHPTIMTENMCVCGGSWYIVIIVQLFKVTMHAFMHGPWKSRYSD